MLTGNQLLVTKIFQDFSILNSNKFKLAKREEKKQKLKDERIQQHLENSQTKVGLIEEKLPGTKRRGNKGFSVVEKDPVALAWYDDKTGQGGIGPDKPWQNKRYI